jgi:hypothetical protein
MLHQILSFVGALLILIAYVGHQLKWMESRSAAYNILNAVGSAILGYIALRPFQVGFVVLEFVWAGVSLYALIRVSRSARRGGEKADGSHA